MSIDRTEQDMTLASIEQDTTKFNYSDNSGVSNVFAGMGADLLKEGSLYQESSSPLSDNRHADTIQVAGLLDFDWWPNILTPSYWRASGDRPQAKLLNTDYPESTLAGNFKISDLVGHSKNLAKIAWGPDTKETLTLRRVENDEFFKQRYADELLRVGKERGLSKSETEKLARGIYSIEAGGFGRYDMLNGFSRETNLDALRREEIAGTKSSAIGYNQLLPKKTADLIVSDNSAIVSRLKQMANEEPARKAELLQKAKLVQDLRTHVPGKINDRQFLAAVHSLNLDSDVGPILQARQIDYLLRHKSMPGLIDAAASRANEVKDAVNQYDSIVAADPRRKAEAVDKLLSLFPTSTLPEDRGPGQRAKANVQLTRDQTDNIEAKRSLRDRFMSLPYGVSSALDRDKLSVKENYILDNLLLNIQKSDPRQAKLGDDARLLQMKVYDTRHGGITADKLKHTAVYLAHLSGHNGASNLLAEGRSASPSKVGFSRQGLRSNDVAKGKTTTELLLSAYRHMNGPNSLSTNPGIAELEKAFKRAK